MDEDKGCKGRGQGSWGRTEAVGFGLGGKTGGLKGGLTVGR